MLIILIILLAFTDFELSGQNIETEAISFCKIQGIEFLINTGTYLLHCIMSVYRHMQKNNKPVRSENLTSGQIFFIKGFIWPVGLREQLC